ncbi:MAG: ATP-binding cassette domain-containing protein [Bacteroidia bacterium]|nr:ATP-binding cassette domain-containing protein [Bacteroidia bacterium]
MNLLSVNNLSKAYGDRVLFRNISFGINQGDKVALVAKNGSGKSTLFKILKGIEIADSGESVFRKDIMVSFLDQDIILNEELTVIDHVFASDNKLTRCIKAYEKAVKLSEEGHVSAANLLESSLAEMNELNGWDYEMTVKEILSRLELSNFEQSIKTLSGGQKKRLALAQVLINKPDLLIMDEPTNHLDIDMIEWLENYIAKEDISVLLVTHDRYFLDAVCNTVLELDNTQLYEYRGDYSYFVTKKAERETIFNSEVDKAKNLYKRELEWVRKMPKARTVKSKSRVDAFSDIEIRAKQKRIDKQVELSVKMERLGSKILELIKISKSFGSKKILEPFSYTFKKGEKIGIIGKNGVGKSTFLNILQGLEGYDTGKIQTGETVIFGYYSQGGIKVSEDKRVIEVVRDIADYIPLANGTQLSASQLLTRFNFPPEVQFSYVKKLSGGEKRRLYLLTVLQKNPNFLILDEPTNDLDIPTLQVLEEFLADFGGCVIIVSHDRYFVDKLVDHVFVFEGDGYIKDYPGNYTEYRDWKQDQKAEEKKEIKATEEKREIQETEKTKGTEETKKVVVEQEKKEISKKLSFKDKHELETLEKEIAEHEKVRTELEALLSETTDYEKLNELGAKLKKNNEEMDAKSFRWIELQEKIG